jgi:hypothetical protein
LSVFWFWRAAGLQTEMVCRNEGARRPVPEWRYADHWRLIHDCDRQSVTWLAAIQQACIFVFHPMGPVTNGTYLRLALRVVPSMSKHGIYSAESFSRV